jgi:hypothetical protein
MTEKPAVSVYREGDAEQDRRPQRNQREQGMKHFIVASALLCAALAVDAQPVFTVDTIAIAKDITTTTSAPVSAIGQPVQPAMQWQMFGVGSPYYSPAHSHPIPLLTVEYDGTLTFGTPMSTVNFNAGASEDVVHTGELPVRGYIVVRLGGQAVLLPYMLPSDIKPRSFDRQ